MRDIIVFLGPTLAHKDAKNILPHACYLPPARCGDVLRATRLNPQSIALIDGNFESSAAVWHKEILFALEKGITVYGASSMGALRARELKKFGMIGVGQVVENYFHSLDDDDAVAVLHGSRASEFYPKTQAQVNITASIREALLQNMIDSKTAMIIERAAKELFYPFKTIEMIVQKASEAVVDSQIIEKFYQWIYYSGWVDIKKQDAISLLIRIAEDSDFSRKPEINFKLERSLFFRTHYKQVMCRPFLTDQVWLPIQEKVASMSRYLGPIYRQTRRLAYLLSACNALAQKNLTEQDESDNLYLGLPANFATSMWREVNDCDLNQQKNFFDRYTQIKQCFDFNFNHSATKETPIDYLLGLMKLSLTKEYETYKKETPSQSMLLELFKEKEPVKYRIFSLMSSLWWLVEQYATRLKLIPYSESIQAYSNKFRSKHKLFSINNMNNWLARNDLKNQDYSHLMLVSTRLNYLVLQNNLDSLGVIDTEEEVWWFLDALYLSGVYDEAKLLLRDKTLIKNREACYAGYSAYDLDFLPN